MSETTQLQKPSANHPPANPKVEREAHHPSDLTATVDSTGPAPDELFSLAPSGILNPAGSSVLSHEPSTLLQLHTVSRGTGSTRPAALPSFSGKNFAGVPTRSARQTPVQPKLTVGAAHDPSEEEADQVAEQVMRMPAPVSAAPDDGADAPEPGGNSVQHAPEEDEIQTKPLAATIRPFVQRTVPPRPPALSPEIDPAKKRGAGKTISGEREQPSPLSGEPLFVRRRGAGGEAEDELQTKRTSAADSFEVGSDFENRVKTTGGGGSPLPAETRAFMEPRFGADFSGVRLHSGGEAAELNRSVSAQAFTLGRDIYLGEGQTEVASDDGQRLLAHELTHVVQQTGVVRRESETSKKKDGVKPRKPLNDKSLLIKKGCCEDGANLWSPAKAQEAFGKKHKPPIEYVTVSEQAKKPDGTLGPKNTVKGYLWLPAVASLKKLLKDASENGAEVKCIDLDGGRRTYRSLERQWEKFHESKDKQTGEWHDMSRSKVALPGTSNHGTGTAIDFMQKGTDLDWLRANAGKYGWVNLPSEDWHYDYGGTPGIIDSHRSTLKKMFKGKELRYRFGKKGSPITDKEKTSLNTQYKAAEVYLALRFNEKKNYPPDTWRKVQERVGMSVDKCTGKVDKKTVEAIMKWQESHEFTNDGKVTQKTLENLEKLDYYKPESGQDTCQQTPSITRSPLAQRASSLDGFDAGSDFENRVAATSGGGSPLPDETRAFMEPRFGADFSGVRLHAGGEAADLNQSVSARAFTLGRDIYLGEGQAEVASDGGKRLLAHELTHVVQQGGANQLRRASEDEPAQENIKTPSSDIAQAGKPAEALCVTMCETMITDQLE